MMLLILKLVSEAGWYAPIDTNRSACSLLISFLNSIRGENGINYYKKILSDQNENWGGMYSYLICKNMGNIYISYEFDDKEFPDECEISIPTFAKMLDDWSEILKQKLPYIVVIHDGASITMQGYDQDPSNLVKKSVN